MKDMLVKLLEGQTRLEHELTEIKAEVKKNSIEIETIGKNINIIVDIQTAHKEQHDFLFKNTDSPIEEKTDLMEIVVSSVSKDVKEVDESVDVIFVEKVLNEIRRFYKLNGYDFVNPININDLVEYTKLSENEVSKVVKALEVKGYLLEFCWKDKNGCEFFLNDLGKQKLLNI